MPALPPMSFTFGGPGSGKFYSVKREEKRDEDLDKIKNRLKFMKALKRDLTYAAHLWVRTINKKISIYDPSFGRVKGVFCTLFFSLFKQYLSK